MKNVDLYGRVCHAVLIDCVSSREPHFQQCCQIRKTLRQPATFKFVHVTKQAYRAQIVQSVS